MSPSRRVVLATGNAGKQREFAALLAPLGFEIITQAQLGIAGAAETGDTFEENALLKARHAAGAAGLPALADDSGLEVDALHGRPGVHSARYAGASASDADNNALLLRELAASATHQGGAGQGGDLQASRRARFRCVVAWVRDADDPAPLFARGVWEGHIATAPAGEGGFGYDPLFIPLGQSITAAQMSPAAKNAVSHRGQALAALLRLLR